MTLRVPDPLGVPEPLGVGETLGVEDVLGVAVRLTVWDCETEGEPDVDADNVHVAAASGKGESREMHANQQSAICTGSSPVSVTVGVCVTLGDIVAVRERDCDSEGDCVGLGVSVSDEENVAEGVAVKLELCEDDGESVWLADWVRLGVTACDGVREGDGVSDSVGLPVALAVPVTEEVFDWLGELDPLFVSVPLGLRDPLAVSLIDVVGD